MKKVCALILMVLLLSLSACKTGKEAAPQPRLREDVTMENLVAECAERYGMGEYLELEEELLTELLGLKPGDILAGYGRISLQEDSPDHLILLEAAEGKRDKIEKALQKRLLFEQRAYADHLSGAGPKTTAGRCFLMGDTGVLFILGREGQDPEEEAKRIEEELRAAFWEPPAEKKTPE